MQSLKLTIYTFLLLFTISGELVHLAYNLSYDQVSIEMDNETKGEHESEENKDLGEDASEIPSSEIHLYDFLHTQIDRSKSTLVFVDDPYSRVSTPPPDNL